MKRPFANPLQISDLKSSIYTIRAAGVFVNLSRLLAFPHYVPEQVIDLPSGFLLHIGQDMAVSVQRDRNGGVPQPITHHLGMYPLLQQHGRVRVPQVVEAAVRHPQPLS